MTDVLSTQNNYRSLSIKDLLQARDLYHFHLLNKPNVVGTAVGLYLIRNGDPEPAESALRHGRAPKPEKRNRGERTLWNSSTREYSWPCVHAFVSRWREETAFGGGKDELHPEDIVPKALYLPDGRRVPVCVTRVDPVAAVAAPPRWVWPGGLYGGGMPVIVNTQGRDRTATAGGLVTDGHTTYALTSRHVCGDGDEPVYTLARGKRVEIGRASDRRLGRLAFSEVYPDYAGQRTFVTLDTGLVEISDVDAWTSRYVDLTDVGGLADLNTLNITVRLIDAPVVAIGAASGRLEGRIKALFYRYKSVGGYDYVSDFLIAPRDLGTRKDAPKPGVPHSQTRPGDSGAVWHLVLPKDEDQRAIDRPAANRRAARAAAPDPDAEFHGIYRPLAVQWGGQAVSGGAGDCFAFALATSLTTVCRALDVELVVEHNTGVLPYWGQMGHYSIAAVAIAAVGDATLNGFLAQNLPSISFNTGDLARDKIKKLLETVRSSQGLVPLADVPDLVWKTYVTKPGGRDDKYAGKGRTTGPEHPTHYADMDFSDEDGLTLAALCGNDKSKVSVPVWQEFYDRVGRTAPRDRGLLPFRVWQFFDSMVSFAAAGQAAEFLCAAGLLSHYVGDACQPLHGSMYADGYSDQPVTITHHKRDTGEEYTEESHVGAGVHSTFETAMIDRKSQLVVEGLLAQANAPGAPIGTIASGQDAAFETIALMIRAGGSNGIPPKDLVDAYIEAGGKKTVAVQDALWDEFGDRTIATMADGARVLASIWEAAWRKGRQGAAAPVALDTIDPSRLIELYEDPTFVESLDLDHIGAVLK